MPHAVRFLPQRRSGTHWLLHRHRCHAGADQAREDGGHLRSRDPDEVTAELHGADGGPVQLHSRLPPGSSGLWEHRGGGSEPLHLHPETVSDRDWRACHQHGAGIQGGAFLFLNGYHLGILDI